MLRIRYRYLNRRAPSTVSSHWKCVSVPNNKIYHNLIMQERDLLKYIWPIKESPVDLGCLAQSLNDQKLMLPPLHANIAVLSWTSQLHKWCCTGLQKFWNFWPRQSRYFCSSAHWKMNYICICFLISPTSQTEVLCGRITCFYKTLGRIGVPASVLKRFITECTKMSRQKI